MARFTVKVHPRARRSAVTGRLGDAWKLDLTASPVEGKANQECVRFLAELMGVPRTRVRIVTGLTSRTKLVEIEGVTEEEFTRAAGI
jgi:uncharacterized protein (TIGR00251 family)